MSTPLNRRRAWATGLVFTVLSAVATVAVASAPGADAETRVLRGRVLTAATPLGSFTVTLFLAGRSSDAPALPLGVAETDATGAFQLSYAQPSGSAIVYVVAEDQSGPVSPAVLASVLATDAITDDVVVNERTTVATSYAMAQFLGPAGIAGPAPGITNAAGMARNLADPFTGELGEVLVTPPNGSETSTLKAFNSLANMVAACMATPVACATLLDAATPPGGTPPADTLRAMGSVARNPANSVNELFALSLAPPAPYAPALALPPPAWTIALRFHGDGSTLDGPGNFAIDHEGNLWVTNNYGYGDDPTVPVCGSDLVAKFTPTGQPAPGSPFRGGGLSGAGFGIDIDRYGDVWVGNYGFAAPEPGCPADLQPAHNSVSKFAPDGTPLSPETGFTQGGVNWVQGTISDRDGNIWMANCESSTLTRYPNGDPDAAVEIGDLGIVQPFDIVDNGAQLFVTGIATNNVAVLARDGTPAAGSPVSGGGVNHPLGIAADSGGNVWVANSGLVDLPCPERPIDQPSPGSVTLLSPEGTPATGAPFTGGGLTIPWGITVDGDDNVWVANFAGKRLSQLCGANPTHCPPGISTGEAISPNITGYGFDGLVRNTGVAVDPSGNVWLANNWLEVPIQTNPGGHEIVAFVGLAPPVQRAAPLPKPVPAPPVTAVTSTPVTEPLADSGDEAGPRLTLGVALLAAGAALRARRRRPAR